MLIEQSPGYSEAMILEAVRAPTPVRFSRATYHRMGEAGILPRKPRVELLNGEIIQMSPIGSPHVGVVDWLNNFFTPLVAGRAICRIQGPIVLDKDSEPEPDLALLVPRADFYAKSHPGPREVLLLIEVAESSIDHDLGLKRRLYAKAGIAEYWVFDLNRNVLIVHRRPAGDAYAEVHEFSSEATVSPAALPDVEVALATILTLGA